MQCKYVMYYRQIWIQCTVFNSENFQEQNIFKCLISFLLIERSSLCIACIEALYICILACFMFHRSKIYKIKYLHFSRCQFKHIIMLGFAKIINRERLKYISFNHNACLVALQGSVLIFTIIWSISAENIYIKAQ